METTNELHTASKTKVGTTIVADLQLQLAHKKEKPTADFDEDDEDAQKKVEILIAHLPNKVAHSQTPTNFLQLTYDSFALMAIYHGKRLDDSLALSLWKWLMEPHIPKRQALSYACSVSMGICA